jgi:predicted nucleic acid-binding protein
MIATYLDASVLVRLCAGEGDLRYLEEAMLGLPLTSVLAAVQVPLAIEARFHRGAVDREQRQLLLAIAEKVLGSVGQVGLTASVRREAIAAAGGHQLSTPDAIHVGTAVVVGRHEERRGNRLRFCTADERQGEAAAARLGRDSVVVLAPV